MLLRTVEIITNGSKHNRHLAWNEIYMKMQHKATNLDHRVRALEELDESVNNTTFDDLLNRWVTLLGKQFPELCRAVELSVHLI